MSMSTVGKVFDNQFGAEATNLGEYIDIFAIGCYIRGCFMCVRVCMGVFYLYGFYHHMCTDHNM